MIHVRINLCFNNGKNKEQTKITFMMNFTATNINESFKLSHIIILKKTSFTALKNINKIKLQFNFLASKYFKVNKQISPYSKLFSFIIPHKQLYTTQKINQDILKIFFLSTKLKKSIRALRVLLYRILSARRAQFIIQIPVHPKQSVNLSWSLSFNLSLFVIPAFTNV